MKSFIRIGKKGTHYYLDGREVTQEEYEKDFPPIKSDGGMPALQQWKKPMEMDSLAIHPDDVPAAMERDRKRGLTIDYCPDGRPIIHSEQQKRDYMKMLSETSAGKLHDRNSYV